MPFWGNDLPVTLAQRFPASRGSFPVFVDGRKETSAMGRKWL